MSLHPPEKPNSSQQAIYKPQLDGLRGIAFGAVFCSHAVPPSVEVWTRATGTEIGPWIAALIRSGRFGVDLFFVLSSYLITDLLLRERLKYGTVDVKAFWMRRALRIWPLYYVFIVFAFVLGPYVMPHEQLPSGYKLALVSFTGNWAIAFYGWQPSITMHLWSISIEEQFYVAWPLLVRWVRPSNIAKLSVALLFLSYATRFYMIESQGDGLGPHLWCNSVARLDPIAMGALAALLLNQRSFTLPAGLSAVGAIAACITIVAVSRYEQVFNSPACGASAYLLVSVSCLVLLLCALSGRSNWLLTSRPAAYLGRVSYGAYVFHFFFCRLLDQRTSLGVIKPLLTLALTLTAAAISYQWLELPFLKLKSRFRRANQPQPHPVETT